MIGRKGCVLVLWTMVATLAAGPAAADQVITILHTNDLHGDLVAVCRAATVIERIRKDTPDALLFDAGDFSAEDRSLEHVREGRAVTLTLLGRLRYDAATPGNHDMDLDVPKSMLAQARVPLLYANLTPNAMLKAKVRTVPFIVKEVKGVRVGVMGLTVNGAPAVLRAKQVLPQVRERADLVIALTHLGLPADEELAREVPGIDLIIGAHTHINLDSPRVAGGTAIVMAGGHGEYIGLAEVTLDETKRPKLIRGRLISLWTPDVAPSEAAFAWVRPLVAHVAGQRVRLGEVIGEASAAFTGRRDELENAMGNLAADVLRARFKTDLALLRGNVLSPQLAKGPITVADLYHTIRWDAPAVNLSLSGDLLRQVLEHSLDNDYFYLRMSGARVWYDLRRPKGQRLIRAEVAGQPLDPKRDYRIATEEWLANGRNEYTWFLQANRVDRTTANIRDILIEHIRKAKTIAPPAADRTVDAAAAREAA